jgi:hypothetical protein
VKRAGKSPETIFENGSPSVKDADHQQRHDEARRRLNLRPMRSDDQGDASSEWDGAERHRQKYRPAQSGGALWAAFKSENALARLGVDQTGFDPPLNPGLPLCLGLHAP